MIAWVPQAEAFVLVGSLTHARPGHQATLRPYGSVLVVGGRGDDASMPLVAVFEFRQP